MWLLFFSVVFSDDSVEWGLGSLATEQEPSRSQHQTLCYNVFLTGKCYSSKVYPPASEELVVKVFKRASRNSGCSLFNLHSSASVCSTY